MSRLHRGSKERVNPIDALDQVTAAFQPFYADRLTKEDASEIKTNLARYFDLLARWRRETQSAEAGDTASMAAFPKDTTNSALRSEPAPAGDAPNHHACNDPEEAHA